MPLLQGLARLLELLSNWFNVTLGCKLMEHLRKWLEPEKLSQSQKSWKAGEEPKIAAGIYLGYKLVVEILFQSIRSIFVICINGLACNGREFDYSMTKKIINLIGFFRSTFSWYGLGLLRMHWLL